MINQAQEEKITREEMIEDVRNICGLQEDNLSWSALCEKTDFDSFATALAFGLSWKDSNMGTMPIAHLRMAVFNLKHFPKAST